MITIRDISIPYVGSVLFKGDYRCSYIHARLHGWVESSSYNPLLSFLFSAPFNQSIKIINDVAGFYYQPRPESSLKLHHPPVRKHIHKR